jgi:hypothetical protein
MNFCFINNYVNYVIRKTIKHNTMKPGIPKLKLYITNQIISEPANINIVIANTNFIISTIKSI